MESRREKQRIERAERNGGDIISTLPDFLLIHILSFLPTRDTVITSILLSRQRPLWTLLPILNLDQRTLLRNEHTFSFVDTVSRIWTLRNAIPQRTLRIRWTSNCQLFYVDTWLRATIHRAMLQELDLFIYTYYQALQLPRTPFFSTTLVVLKFTDQIFLNPPHDCSLPSLRILQLSYVKYVNHNSLSTLLAACLLLQHLTLKMSESDLKYMDKNAAKFNIIVLIAPLKRLLFSSNANSSSYKLQINTPALEYFNFLADLGGHIVLENQNLPNLFELVIGIRSRMSIQNYANRIWDVVSMDMWISTAHVREHYIFCALNSQSLVKLPNT